MAKSARIAVVGAGISGLTTAYRLAQAGHEVHVFDARDLPGGTIGTISRDGYRVETGPNGFLDSRQETLDLCTDLGLGAHLEPATGAAGNRYTVRDGRLVALPSSPLKFLTAPTMSLGGRLRTMTEMFRRPRPADDTSDETVFDFAKRRVGRECAERLIDAFITGVYAGDPHRMSAESTISRLVEIERAHGSLTRGMLAAKKAAKAANRKSGSPSGPGGHLTSLKGGMNTLILALVEFLGKKNVHLGSPLEAVARADDRWSLSFAGADGAFEADAVVCALPAHALAHIDGISVPLSSALGRIPYAPIAVVSLGYARERVSHPLDGFGFVACDDERICLLGSLWTSSIFADRAPDGHVLIRNMVGGMRHPERTELEEPVLVELVRDQLDRLVGLEGDPSFVHVTRWAKGIPQYHVGHREILSDLDEALTATPGLFLTGNAYRGVGINDCVRDALATTERVGEWLAR